MLLNCTVLARQWPTSGCCASGYCVYISGKHPWAFVFVICKCCILYMWHNVIKKVEGVGGGGRYEMDQDDLAHFASSSDNDTKNTQPSTAMLLVERGSM